MEKTVSVGLSIALIILLALLSDHSKTIAAITTTMPTKIPIGLWIIYVAEKGSRQETAKFTEGVLISLFPTVIFTIVVWLAAKAGWGLAPILAIGYVAWGISLGIFLGIQRLLT